jgi:DNA polymerase-3 subunit delta'
LLIGAKDAGRRNKEGFCYNLSRKPLPGSRKIGIIDDADMLNEEGANCLLKTLEEPPPRSLLILIGSHPCKQLPTIRSRCQIIRFRPLSTANLIDLLLQDGCVENPEQAERLAAQSGGGLEGALVWADESLWPFRGQLLELLGQMPPDSEQLSKLVQKFIDEKSSPTERRKRLRLAMQLAEEFYRGLLYHLLGLDPLPQLRDEAVAAAVEQAAAQMKNSGLSATKIVIALTDRCLTAQQHIALYANPAALIGCWADDMARCPLAG